MPDFADHAAAAETIHRNAALSSRITPPAFGPSAHECEDCGEPIPEARRLAVPGCTRCVVCQAEHDGGRP